MLPKQCHWLTSPDAAWLRWNYGCIAVVRADDNGASVQIMFRERDLFGRAPSVAQGMRHVERWLAGQGRGALPYVKRKGRPPFR
jgi:hypothetical protein